MSSSSISAGSLAIPNINTDHLGLVALLPKVTSAGFLKLLLEVEFVLTFSRGFETDGEDDLCSFL